MPATGSSPHLPLPVRWWILSLVVCALATWLAFVRFDVAVAVRVQGLLGSRDLIGSEFSSSILLGLEAAVALMLVTIRIRRGRLSPFGEALALACFTSIVAYAVNDSILKLIFGIPSPAAVLLGMPHALHLFTGNRGSGFPSGHMVLASAFAGVFMRLYRSSILALSALLLFGAVLLVLGDWHFISDVIGGAFLGISAGLLAGELWILHSYRIRPNTA